MAYYFRYFIFMVCVLFSMSSYARDHIICQLSNPGIPSTVQAGIEYTNTYSCFNLFPLGIEPLQLAMSVHLKKGAINNLKIGGSCTTQRLAPFNSCSFTLAARFTQTARFVVQISAGTLYYLEFPAFEATVPDAAAIITWPSLSVGSAQVNASGLGSGIFVPDAVDSSGHKVVYTFILSGAGRVEGNQNGSFTLSGIDINNPGTITVIATADDAAPVTGTPIAIKVNNVPSKIVAIYNNTSEILYPIIESPILSVVDNWLQAEFKVPAAQLGVQQFQQTRLHRTYPCPAGILPNQSVLVSVPFYMQAVPTPQQPLGSKPDDFIDNFNAMRVYLYDVQANFLDNAYNPDQPNRDTLYSPGITCLSGCCVGGELPTYNSGPNPVIHVNAIPAPDPVQLLEYTFGDAVKSLIDGTYSIDITHVDYDVSAVDQVYLPIAMEPYGNAQVGYTGVTTALDLFRSTLNNFVAAQPWPIYVGSPAYNFPRVPGAYNVIIGDQSLSPAATTVAQEFRDYWTDCIRSSTPPALHPYHAQCLAVNDLFQKNFLSNSCHVGPSPGLDDLLRHIYGWVAFTCPNQLNNSLLETPGADYKGSEAAYQILQNSAPVSIPNYAKSLAFNAYVGLIHNQDMLNMNIYAYSIDDAVGNMNEIGEGIIVAVGGDQGLPNKNQFDPSKIITVIPGPGTNYFKAFNVNCVGSQYNGTLLVNQSFKIQAVTFPCDVRLTDTHDDNYNFTITNAPPYPVNTNGVASGFISCKPGDPHLSWCNTINVDKQNIPTQPPTQP